MLTTAQRRKERREALPIAMLIQLMANIHRDTERRLQPFEMHEVLEWLGYPPEPEPEDVEPPRPPPEELRAKLEGIAQMFPPGHGQGGAR